MSFSTNETTGKLSYSISNFKSHYFSMHGDDILTDGSDHDSVISDISLPDTPVSSITPSISGQRSRQRLLQRSLQRSVQSSCHSCLSCENLKQIVTKKDEELAEYASRLKILNQLELTISEKGKVQKFVLHFNFIYVKTY